LYLKGLRFRDCKASNIVLSALAQFPASYQPYLVDMEGLRWQWVKFSRRDEHIAIIRLAASCFDAPNLSRTDFLRFFNRYLYFINAPQASNRQTRHDLWYYLRAAALKIVKKS